MRDRQDAKCSYTICELLWIYYLAYGCADEDSPEDNSAADYEPPSGKDSLDSDLHFYFGSFPVATG